MVTKQKRMTFAVPPDMEALLAAFKKEVFYDRTQSDMIRELIMAGMRALEDAAANADSAEQDYALSPARQQDDLRKRAYAKAKSVFIV